MTAPHAGRLFDVLSAWDAAAGEYVPAMRVVCRKCGASDEIRVYGRNRPLPVQAAVRKFRDRKWQMGATRSKDVCPACQAGLPAPDVPPEPKEKTMNVQSPVLKADPPRQPTPEDKRVIVFEIDALWTGDDRGYQSGHSDKTVANKLGVPRKWVEDVRRDMFGELGRNEDIVAFVKRLDTVEAQLGKAAADLNRLLKEATPLLELVRR